MSYTLSVEHNGVVMNSNDIIRKLKSDYKLRVKDIAELIGTSENTVRNWLGDPAKGRYRVAPDMAAICLSYALHLRKLGFDPLEPETPTSDDDPLDRESELD